MITLLRTFKLKRVGWLFSFLIVAALTAIFATVASGWMTARRAAAEHQARANQLHESGYDGAALGEERLNILLRIVDPGFFQHNGMVSLTPFARARTITQRVAWPLAGKPKTGGFGRFWLTGYALGLETRLSKGDILGLFLDHVYMGRNGSRSERPINGFFEASETFFGKEPIDISRQEYLSLVAILESVGRLSEPYYKDQLNEQVLRIERLLAGECETSYYGDSNLYRCESRRFDYENESSPLKVSGRDS